MLTTPTQVAHAMYIAYYQRPADPQGLQYWVSLIQQHGSWHVVSAAFGAPENPEFAALYGPLPDRAALVKAIYLAAFERSAADEEVSFWVRSPHSNLDLAFAIVNGAQNQDAATLQRKMAFSDAVARLATQEAYLREAQRLKLTLDALDHTSQVTDAFVQQLLAGNSSGSTAMGLEGMVAAAQAQWPAGAQVSKVNTGMGPIPTKASPLVRWLDYRDEAGREYEWSSRSVTVSFPETIPSDHAGDPGFQIGWASVPVSWRSVWLQLMNQAVAPIDLTLQPASSADGDIRVVLGSLDGTFAGWAKYPAPGIGGDLQIRQAFARERMDANPSATDRLWGLLVHELGHSLGLKHPFEGSPLMPSNLDSKLLTIMSYTYPPDLWPSVRWSYTPASGLREAEGEYKAGYRFDYGIVDLSALMAIYGPNPRHHAGDTVHRLEAPSPQTWLYRTISDAAGIDTLDLSTLTRPSRIDLRPGTLSDVDVRLPQDWKQQFIDDGVAFYQRAGIYNPSVHDWIVRYASQMVERSDVTPRLWNGLKALGIADGTLIENLVLGDADDLAHDNEINNLIRTGGGNDTVYLGAGGLDGVDGGAGVDVVVLPTSVLQANIARLGEGWLVQADAVVAALLNVEYLADPTGGWLALDTRLAATPPQVKPWTTWAPSAGSVPDVTPVGLYSALDTSTDLKTLSAEMSI